CIGRQVILGGGVVIVRRPQEALFGDRRSGCPLLNTEEHLDRFLLSAKHRDCQKPPLVTVQKSISDLILLLHRLIKQWAVGTFIHQFIKIEKRLDSIAILIECLGHQKQPAVKKRGIPVRLKPGNGGISRGGVFTILKKLLDVKEVWIHRLLGGWRSDLHPPATMQLGRLLSR